MLYSSQLYASLPAGNRTPCCLALGDVFRSVTSVYSCIVGCLALLHTRTL